MEKISVMIITFLVIASVGTNFGMSSIYGSAEISYEDNTAATAEDTPVLSNDGSPDVPTWTIGSSWTYYEEYWLHEALPGRPLVNMTMEKQLTYTVSALEVVDIEGVNTPVYNLTLDGEILSGSGHMEPANSPGTIYPFTVVEGNTTGYILHRLDDLGIVEEFELMQYELDIGLFPIFVDNLNIRAHEPTIENYDFPITLGAEFMADNTIYVDGFNDVYAPGEGGDVRNHSYVENYTRENEVHEEISQVTVPGGTYDTFVIHEIFDVNVTGGREVADGWEDVAYDDGGFQTTYYNSDVQNYVKQVLDTTDYVPRVEWVRELESYSLPANPNSLSLEPSHAAVGDTVTIEGSFPDHPSKQFTLNIPMGDIQIPVQTGTTGTFSETFVVPHIEDNTPSPGQIGSVGIIAQLNEAPTSVYQVATLTILQGPMRPVNPLPEDGATVTGTSVELSVYVDHPEGQNMDVSFYDASDDTIIGVDSNVASGNRASVTWSDLETGMTYMWYAVAHDREYSSVSQTWEFTTILERTLTITVEGEGTTIPEEGSHVYNHGESVTVQAIPETGWYFSHWTGDFPPGEGEEDEISITMDSDKNITAHFEIYTYNLTLDIAEGEGAIKVDGDVIEIPYTGVFDHGTVVEIEAVPDANWFFHEWTGDYESTDRIIHVNMIQDYDINAHFAEMLDYLLTIERVGQGSTEPRVGSHSYEEGAVVNVSATPDTGWFFSHWTGDFPPGEEENSNITIIMDDNKTLTAHFSIFTYDLTVDVMGDGEVIIDPEEESYDYGTLVDLQAIPDTGWFFSHWSGDTDSITHGDVNNPHIVIEITEDIVLTAHFEEGPLVPTEPTPANDVTGISSNPELSVFVEHQGGNSMDVYFYDASDDSLIGTNEGVESESRANIVWEGLEHGRLYQWYVSAHDGTYQATSEVWNFTTIDMHNLTISVEGEGSTVPAEGTHSYEHGEEVTITATPELGWYFAGWTGDYTGIEDEITITIDGDKEITAHFEEYRTLTIVVEGEGTTTPTEGQNTYRHGEEVTILAIPDTGWYFAGWTGDYTGIEDEITITMDSDKEITAHFEEYVTLTVSVEGEGFVTIDGVEESLPYSEPYRQGTSVTLEAVPDSGWYFAGWTGDHPDDESEEDIIEIVMDEDKTLEAVFQEFVTLTVTVEGDGTVTLDGETITVPYTSEYRQGTEITLVASPSANMIFTGWTGDHIETEEQITIIIEEDMGIQANFDTAGHVLTINIEGEGRTDPEAGTHTYAPGTEVDLTATPEEGWRFAGWTGGHVDSKEETTVRMNRDRTITARFEVIIPRPAYFEINITSHDETVKEGEKVTVQYTVTNTGDLSGTRTIRLRVDGETVDSYEGLTLGPGESYDGSLVWKSDGSRIFDLRIDAVDEDGTTGGSRVTVSVEVEGAPLFPIPLRSILLIIMSVIIVLMVLKMTGIIFKDDYVPKTSLADFEDGDRMETDAMSVDELKEKYSEYNGYRENYESLENEERTLSAKLDAGEIGSEAYDEGVEKIASEKSELEDKLTRLRDDMVNGNYQRSF